MPLAHPGDMWPLEREAEPAKPGSAEARGSVACDQQLIDDLMEAAAKLTEASDKATLAGLKVTMTIGKHMRIPGPSCDAVIVDVERVSVKSRYTPNQGRVLGGH